MLHYNLKVKIQERELVQVNNKAEVIKVKCDGQELAVTRKAFEAYYSHVGFEEVKKRRSTSKKNG